jgi:hypothetical protein
MKKIAEASPNRFLIALFQRLFPSRIRFVKSRLKHENRLCRLAIPPCVTCDGLNLGRISPENPVLQFGIGIFAI